MKPETWNSRLSASAARYRKWLRQKMNRRSETTVITFETFQRTIVRSRRRAKTAWCEQCGADTMMLATDEAAAFLKTTAREIFRQVEAGDVHYLETEKGALLVCCRSCNAAGERSLLHPKRT